MPRLASLAASGMCLPLSPGLPAVTCPVQATLTTGTRVRDHQIVANGSYDRSTPHLEMWISPDSAHKAPRIWDELQAAQPALRTAAWFALQSKYATADLVCLPAPKHNPDGSETMWCHTRPESLYEKLREKMGDFPLHKFWGPIAGIESSRWIARSFVEASRENPPHFAYVYLPHLDYAAQRSGPDSQPAHTACGELDAEIGKLIDDFGTAVGRDPLVVLVAGEYRIRPVSHTLFPNRILRTAGLLAVIDSPEGELLDRQASQAWALADHQVSHIYLRDGSDQNSVEQVASLFRDQAGVGQVLAGAELLAADLLADTPPHTASRCGDIVVVSTLDSWQSYYYWLDDARAPAFARTVDIHRKPGYDPVELHFDRAAGGIPLDVSLVKGSHGAVDPADPYETVFIASQPGITTAGSLAMHEIAGIIKRLFGV